MEHYFKIGQRFTTWQTVLDQQRQCEQECFIQLYSRDSKTLEGQRKHVPNRIKEANMNLKYYKVKLCCYSGGKKYTSRGNGERSSR